MKLKEIKRQKKVQERISKDERTMSDRKGHGKVNIKFVHRLQITIVIHTYDAVHTGDTTLAVSLGE